MAFIEPYITSEAFTTEFLRERVHSDFLRNLHRTFSKDEAFFTANSGIIASIKEAATDLPVNEQNALLTAIVDDLTAAGWGLNATAANDNSFSISQKLAYFLEANNTAWFGGLSGWGFLKDSTRMILLQLFVDQAIYETTPAVNSHNFIGSKTDPAQKNEFPRKPNTTLEDDVATAVYLEARARFLILISDSPDDNTAYFKDLGLPPQFQAIDKYGRENLEKSLEIQASFEGGTISEGATSNTTNSFDTTTELPRPQTGRFRATRPEEDFEQSPMVSLVAYNMLSKFFAVGKKVPSKKVSLATNRGRISNATGATSGGETANVDLTNYPTRQEVIVRDNAILQDAKDYTDANGGGGGGTTDLSGYSTTAEIDAKDAAILSAAEGYTYPQTTIDSRDATTLASAKTYADNEDATTLAAAKLDSSNKDVTILQNANDYTYPRSDIDSKDATTLTAAKAYTDANAGGGVTLPTIGEPGQQILLKAKNVSGETIMLGATPNDITAELNSISASAGSSIKLSSHVIRDGSVGAIQIGNGQINDRHIGQGQIGEPKIEERLLTKILNANVDLSDYSTTAETATSVDAKDATTLQAAKDYADVIDGLHYSKIEVDAHIADGIAAEDKKVEAIREAARFLLASWRGNDGDPFDENGGSLPVAYKIASPSYDATNNRVDIGTGTQGLGWENNEIDFNRFEMVARYTIGSAGGWNETFYWGVENEFSLSRTGTFDWSNNNNNTGFGLAFAAENAIILFSYNGNDHPYDSTNKPHRIGSVANNVFTNAGTHEVRISVVNKKVKVTDNEGTTLAEFTIPDILPNGSQGVSGGRFGMLHDGPGRDTNVYLDDIYIKQPDINTFDSTLTLPTISSAKINGSNLILERRGAEDQSLLLPTSGGSSGTTDLSDYYTKRQTDAHDATTLTEAKAYADNVVAPDLSTYATNASVDEKDATTLATATATAATDATTKDTAVLTAAKSYADTLGVGDGTITTAKIADGAITSAKIGSRQVNDANIFEVSGSKIKDGTITTSKIGAGQIQFANMAVSSVGVSQLGRNSVSTVKIQDGAVTSDKIGGQQVQNQHIANDTIGEEKLAPVVKTKLNASGGGSTADLTGYSTTVQVDAKDAVVLQAAKDFTYSRQAIETRDENILTAAKSYTDTKPLGEDSVDRDQIVDDAVDGSKIANNAVGKNHIVAKGVGLTELDDQVIATLATFESKIDSDAGEAATLAAAKAYTDANTGGSLVIPDGSITEAKIAGAAITHPKIRAGNVITAHMANGAVTGDKIANGVITNSKIGNSAVTNAKIANSTISEAKLAPAVLTKLNATGGSSGGGVGGFIKDLWVNTYGSQDTLFNTGNDQSDVLFLGTSQTTANGQTYNHLSKAILKDDWDRANQVEIFAHSAEVEFAQQFIVYKNELVDESNNNFVSRGLIKLTQNRSDIANTRMYLVARLYYNRSQTGSSTTVSNRLIVQGLADPRANLYYYIYKIRLVG